MQIDIKETYAIIKDGFTCKTIKLEDLVKAFSGIKVAIKSPLLPQNCIRYSENGNIVTVLLFHEQARFNATVFNNNYENCLRPRMIMKYSLLKANDSYIMQNSSCFGVKDQFIALNNNTQLYGLPFPNINSSGWICWGSNSSGGNFRSLIGLSLYIDRLFGTPFNNHLYNSSLLKTTHGFDGPEALFKYTSDLKEWDDSLFEHIGTSYTLDKI